MALTRMNLSEVQVKDVHDIRGKKQSNKSAADDRSP